jgi:hypothetical protein
MPKFVIEREIPGAGNLTDAELREISRKSLAVLILGAWALRFSGCKATSQATRSTACISLQTRQPYASTQSGEAFRQIASLPSVG